MFGEFQVKECSVDVQAHGVGWRGYRAHGVAYTRFVQHVHTGRTDGVSGQNVVTRHDVLVEQQHPSPGSGEKGGERGAPAPCTDDHDVVFALFQAGVLTAPPFDAPSLDPRAGAKDQGYRLPLSVIGRRVWLAAQTSYAELMMKVRPAPAIPVRSRPPPVRV